MDVRGDILGHNALFCVVSLSLPRSLWVLILNVKVRVSYSHVVLG